MRTVALAVLLATVAGCGGPRLAPVTGKVTHNGKGLTAGDIWFHAAEGNAWKGDRPSALLQLDGSFTMKTYPHGTGVPPGTWKVTLGPALANRVGRPQYADPSRTPWTIDVPDSGVADRVFEVN